MPELNVAVQGLFQLPANESFGRFSSLCLVDMTPVFTTWPYSWIWIYRTFQSVNRFDASNWTVGRHEDLTDADRSARPELSCLPPSEGVAKRKSGAVVDSFADSI